MRVLLIQLLLRFSPLSSVQNLVHDTPLLRLLSTHEEIPLHHPFNLLQAVILRQMPLINHVQLLPDPQDFLRVDGDVARLARVPARDLVDHDAAVRQHEALARRAAAQQQRAHRRRLAQADGRHGRPDVLHRVVDREPGRHAAARRVDVQRDRLLRVVGFEEEELRDDAGAEDFFDFAV